MSVRDTMCSLALVRSLETYVYGEILRQCYWLSSTAWCHRGCPSTRKALWGHHAVTCWPNKFVCSVTKSLREPVVSSCTTLFIPPSPPTCQEQSQGSPSPQVWMSSHLAGKHICSSVNRYSLNSIWAPEFGLQVNVPKANLLGCSVDWFSFCRSNSILRNVRLASSALFLLQLRQRPVPKRGDEKAQGREIFFCWFSLYCHNKIFTEIFQSCLKSFHAI